MERSTYRLWIDIVQMILNKLYRSRQISGVELIRDIPSQRTKLTALLYNSVQEGCGVKHGFPLRHVSNIKLVLR